MSVFSVVIPARYDSTRLPGKPLLDLAGIPMIKRVALRALQSNASRVVVATDDRRVAEVLTGSEIAVQMTRADHRSGSDRVMEVAAASGWPDDHIVVNVQGDEPLIPPAVINQVADLLAHSECGAATLCEPIDDVATVFDPNVVKVVLDGTGRALYFSRAPIPYARDTFPDSLDSLPPGRWWRHVGIYAYRVGVLRRFVDLQRGALEAVESLEQLRLLENGISIAVAEATEAVPGGVDTPTDADHVRALLR